MTGFLETSLQNYNIHPRFIVVPGSCLLKKHGKDLILWIAIQWNRTKSEELFPLPIQNTHLNLTHTYPYAGTPLPTKFTRLTLSSQMYVGFEFDQIQVPLAIAFAIAFPNQNFNFHSTNVSVFHTVQSTKQGNYFSRQKMRDISWWHW